MAKFCKNCGTKLDENTGLCPRCDGGSGITGPNNRTHSEQTLTKKELKKKKKADKKNAKKLKKKEKKEKKKSIRAQWSLGKKIRRFCLKLLIVILILVIIIFSILGVFQYFGFVNTGFISDCLGLMDVESANGINIEDFHLLTDLDTDIVVTNESLAMQVAQDTADFLKLGNAAKELSTKNVHTAEDDVYYRFQQNYNGIPVYGRSMVVVADKSGNVKGVSSNAQNIDFVDTQVDYKSIDYASYAEDFLITKKQLKGISNVSVNTPTEDSLYIYNMGEDKETILVCEIKVLYNYEDSQAAMKVLFDLTNNKILHQVKTMYSDTVVCYGATKDTKSFKGVKNEESTYIMKDSEQNIYILNAENNTYYDPDTGEVSPSVPRLVTSTDEFFGNTEDEVKKHYDRAYSMLQLLSSVSNYFKEYNDTGVGRFVGIYDDHTGKYNGTNAGGGFEDLKEYLDVDLPENTDPNINNPKLAGKIGIVSMGTDLSENLSNCLDTLAHEYTHCITYKNVEWVDRIDHTSSGDPDETGAINEAYSDIFGELIESSINKKEPNWELGKRVIHDPMVNGYPAAVGDRPYKKYATDPEAWWMPTNNDLIDYSHGFSTIISHAAYLMSNGVNGQYASLSLEELSNVWYQTQHTLPSNCSFVILRANMEFVAKIIGLNDEKIQCVSAAFDSVGIGRQEEEGTYNTELLLHVYDKNGDLYNNYNFSITGKEYNGIFKWGIFKKDYSYSQNVSDSNPVSLNIPKGDYSITVTDNNDSNLSLSKSIKIRSNSKNNKIMLSTQFGNSDILNKIDSTKQNSRPSDAVEFNGHYYYLYNNGVASTYEEALQYCQDRGGYLATLTTKEENDFVYSYMVQQNCQGAYFGLSDAANEGNWKWCTGEVLSYQNWHSGEPNGENTEEDYGSFYYKYEDGTWNDGDFGNQTSNDSKAFLCEWGDYTSQSSSSMGEEKQTSHERDVVLVLDRSQSMSGRPLTETKKASFDFIDTVLKEDASIGVVTYDSWAECVCEITGNQSVLQAAVSEISDGGSTNIESGLYEAQSMLSASSARKKIIVLMSDGQPNEGKIDEELIAYADEIKQQGTLIYTIGFFESLDEKSEAQWLMERIASDGCHYEVASADELVFFFNDMADQINGQKYIYVRIACPVDVSVTYNGQMLNSSDENSNFRTDFGTLTFEENETDSFEETPEGQDNRIKVLRLKEGIDYDLKLTGTGRGIMNYTIGFMDEDGNYSDLRKFENIRITQRTKIDTVAAVSPESILNIDEDGDGKYDLKLRAEENGYGEEVKIPEWIIYAMIGAGTLILVDILLLIILKLGKKKKRKVR